VRLKEGQITKLFIIQCTLSATWVISDVIYSNAPGLFNILFFLEVPGDARNFEMERMKMGINRYQSLAFVSVGFLWLLLIKNKLNDFLTARSIWLVPTGLLIVGTGLLSGHRYTVAILVLVLGFMVFTQRLITLRNALAGTLVLAFGLTLSYGFAERMPLAAQRALSALPGITVHRDARLDGSSTLETRRILREEGLKMMSQYLWVGRGFGQSGFGDHSLQWDPTAITYHINQGRFYNGFIGLMVNTGLVGTCFMLLFLLAGSVVAVKVIFHLREHGVGDDFSRVSCIVACLWMANVVAFLALHGDSEYAMKTFSLQAGLLIVCQYMLRDRLREEQPELE
jgi:O-antigen ligase